MKRILSTGLILLISGSACLRAQNGPSLQEINENTKRLEGVVKDLSDSQDDLRKQMQTLAREINELRDKSGKPTGNYASQDEIKRLAEAIQEVDRKRLADNERVLAELSKLGKSLGSTSRPRPVSKDTEKDKPAVNDSGTAEKAQKGDQEGFNYKVKPGDSFSIIAKGYRDQGIKIYTVDIEKANPGVDSKSLTVGQKIFIPVPKDKAK